MFPTIHGVASQGGAGGAPPTASRGGPAVYGATAWASGAGLTQNLGWQFQVGANDITVTHLRLYDAGMRTETVRLYRVSDGTLLASASVTASGGWGEEEVTPVTLTAGQSYVVSQRAGGAVRTVPRTPSSYVLDPAVTYTGSVFGTTDAMPASSTAQHYVSGSFRTQGPASGYRFYRLNITANNGRSTINVAEAQLRQSVGGADAATGGVAYATSVFTTAPGFPASYAFDDDSGTFWSTATTVTAAELWYDLGTAREITVAQYAVQARSDANDGTPKDWTFQASNDLDTWTTLETVTGETGWSNGETRAYTV